MKRTVGLRCKVTSVSTRVHKTHSGIAFRQGRALLDGQGGKRDDDVGMGASYSSSVVSEANTSVCAKSVMMEALCASNLSPTDLAGVTTVQQSRGGDFRGRRAVEVVKAVGRGAGGALEGFCGDVAFVAPDPVAPFFEED